MKIVEINTVDYGSTGRIMFQIADCCRKFDYEVITYSKKWMNKKSTRRNHRYYGFFIENCFDIIFSKFTSIHGIFSYFGTKKLIKELKEFSPDIIHLHNLHDRCICLPVLFNFIKSNKIKVVWTLHDCWAFTGRCPHFIMSKCNKWKNGCGQCPYPKGAYPEVIFDFSHFMWKMKRNFVTGIEDIVIVTPSEWLANNVKQSFLKNYEIKVINNGINLNKFKPSNNKFIKDFGLENKHILLGVANPWSYRKGLDVFNELSERLDDSFRIVLVGTNSEIDQVISKKIISIHKTDSQKDLADIYSSANIFINPTREDTYPTVNMEALACGTPVITFDTGGSPEIIDDSCGVVVPVDDINKLIKEIIFMIDSHEYSREACIKKSLEFNEDDRYLEYLNLYKKICKER